MPCQGAQVGLGAPLAIERAVLNRLGDVRRADPLRAREICDRARHLEHARVGAGREAELRHRTLDERGAGGIGAGEGVELARVHLGVATRGAKARVLALACGGDARGDGGG